MTVQHISIPFAHKFLGKPRLVISMIIYHLNYFAPPSSIRTHNFCTCETIFVVFHSISNKESFPRTIFGYGGFDDGTGIFDQDSLLTLVTQQHISASTSVIIINVVVFSYASSFPNEVVIEKIIILINS